MSQRQRKHSTDLGSGISTASPCGKCRQLYVPIFHFFSTPFPSIRRLCFYVLGHEHRRDYIIPRFWFLLVKGYCYYQSEAQKNADGRDSIREFAAPETPIFMYDKDGKFVVKTLEEVCPAL